MRPTASRARNVALADDPSSSLPTSQPLRRQGAGQAEPEDNQMTVVREDA